MAGSIVEAFRPKQLSQGRSGFLPKRRFCDAIHATIVKENYAEKLVGHASIDSSVIIGEKSCRKNTPRPKMKKKRGRKSKAEITAMAEQKTAEIKTRRLELQPNRTLSDNLDDLP